MIIEIPIVVVEKTTQTQMRMRFNVSNYNLSRDQAIKLLQGLMLNQQPASLMFPILEPVEVVELTTKKPARKRSNRSKKK